MILDKWNFMMLDFLIGIHGISDIGVAEIVKFTSKTENQLVFVVLVEWLSDLVMQKAEECW